MIKVDDEIAAALSPQSPVTASVLLDIHRLLATVVASEQIARLMKDESLHALFVGIERDEITRILLSVAATVRLAEDRISKEPILDLFVNGCGTLIEDMQDPTKIKPLEIREACNKILHSHRMEPTRIVAAPGREALGSHVVLHGTRGTREWEATLDVVQFCQSSAMALEWVVGRK